MRNRGAALYRDVMYERVWGGIPDTESLRTVDTHIARLRKKLGWMAVSYTHLHRAARASLSAFGSFFSAASRFNAALLSAHFSA